MTIQRSYGDIEFECDSCGDTLETFTDDFADAKAFLDHNGWLTRKDVETGKWKHYCDQPCLDTEND